MKATSTKKRKSSGKDKELPVDVEAKMEQRDGPEEQPTDPEASH